MHLEASWILGLVLAASDKERLEPVLKDSPRQLDVPVDIYRADAIGVGDGHVDLDPKHILCVRARPGVFPANPNREVGFWLSRLLN